MYEVDEDESAYLAKVGLILVLSDLHIITSDQYFDLSCSYTGFKLCGTIYHANILP